MADFLAWYCGARGGSVLDVGGTPEFWREAGLDGEVTIPNLAPQPETLLGRMAHVQGSATGLPFGDRAFDIVFSSAMIERLAECGNQECFAREALRVGRGLWVQTPARRPDRAPLADAAGPLPAEGGAMHLLRNPTVWGWITRSNRDEADRLLDELALLTPPRCARCFRAVTFAASASSA
jgi:hypothetical protein